MNFFIFERMEKWIANKMVEACVEKATVVFTKISKLAESVTTESSHSPESFSPEMFELVERINNNIIIPIAGLILTYIAVMQLINMVNDKNTFVDYELQTLFKWMITVSISIYLVSNSMTIIMALFDIGRNVTMSVTNLITSSAATDFMTHVDTIRETAEAYAENKEIITLMSLAGGLTLLSLFITIVSIFVPVIIYVRFFYIYINIAVSSIPMATLTSNKLSNVGENYLKNILALSFQAMFMILVVALFSAFITVAATKTEVHEILLALATGAAMLVLLLLKTESISKSIFAAH